MDIFSSCLNTSITNNWPVTLPYTSLIFLKISFDGRIFFFRKTPKNERPTRDGVLTRYWRYCKVTYALAYVTVSMAVAITSSEIYLPPSSPAERFCPRNRRKVACLADEERRRNYGHATRSRPLGVQPNDWRPSFHIVDYCSAPFGYKYNRNIKYRIF